MGLVHKDVLDLTSVTVQFCFDQMSTSMKKTIYTNPPAGRFGTPTGTPPVILSAWRNVHDPYIELFTLTIHF